MTRSLLALSVFVAATGAAIAGPMPAARPVAQSPAPHRYLVSANLNKLVFWHVPDRDEAPTKR